MTELKVHPAPNKLGAFVGVFTPSILTILGIILFLRLGYVVGSGGLLEALAILAIATTISVITSLSLSAIATNIKVKKGGDYYLISRTLGAEFGGSIGLVLFFAQAISVAFYCIGFGEAVTAIAGWEHPRAPQFLAGGAIAVLFYFSWLGADWASKLQMFIMGILCAALVAFFVGVAPVWSWDRLGDSLFTPAGSPSFWIIFAIFFPAVTGFTQGVSMSGDLRDPSRSLPRGTFWAVALSTIVYIAAMVAFAGAASLETLATDFSAMRKLSWAGWLIDAGVIAATLSSAMASFLGAPRILQSLATDRIMPFLNPFAQGAGPSDNPRRGAILTLVIALGIVSIGQLNLIASIVSMFFLVSYGLLNYATYYEAKADSPSFRPRFRYFDGRLSLVGALLCLAIMLLIDPLSGIASIVVLFGLFKYLELAGGVAPWADSSRSYRLRAVRKHLLAIASEPDHARDWRPHIVAFSDDAHRRNYLLRFASWVEGGSGFTTAVRFVLGDGPQVRKERAEAEKELAAEMTAGGFKAFALAVAAEDLLAGSRIMLQSYGVGPLRANMILLNWLEQATWHRDEARERRYGAALRAALRLGKHVLVLEAEDEEWMTLTATPADERVIDIWWFNDASSRMLLLMSYLMTRTEDWDEATLRVCAAAQPDESEAEATARVKATLDEVRIDAEVLICACASPDDIVAQSENSTLVMMPFRIRNDEPSDPFGGLLEELVSRLPVTALGIAAEEIDLTSQPDEGNAATVAAAAERAKAAELRAQKAEEEAESLVAETERRLEELMASYASDPTKSEAAESFASMATKLREEAVKAVRRAAKARAKADTAHAETETTASAEPAVAPDEAATA